MKSRALPIVVCISMFVVSIELIGWIRGHGKTDWFLLHQRGGRQWLKYASRDGLYDMEFGYARDGWGIAYLDRGQFTDSFPEYVPEMFDTVYGSGTWHGFAFGYGEVPDGPGGFPAAFSELMLPGWFVVGTTILAPFALFRILELRGLRRRRREMGGLCVKCGYDLRATPERCPEYGMVCGVRANHVL